MPSVDSGGELTVDANNQQGSPKHSRKYVVEKKYSLQFISIFGRNIDLYLKELGPVAIFWNKNINERDVTNQRVASNHMTCHVTIGTSDFLHLKSFPISSLQNLRNFWQNDRFIRWHVEIKSINWQAMSKVKKKSHKQRHEQRLDKVRKRDERATNDEVSKTNKCVQTSSIKSNKTEHRADNSRDEVSRPSNMEELSSRNRAVVDFPNVLSEAQAIIDKYLQS